MTGLSWLRGVLLQDSESLLSSRQRVALPVGKFAAVLLTAFAVNDAWQGRVALAAALFAVVALVVVDVLALRRGQPAPVHFGFILLPAMAGMLLSVLEQGIQGALWAYPIVLIGYFVLPRRLALAFSVFILGALTAAVAIWVAPTQAVRVFATLVLTIVMVNMIFKVIGELQDGLVQQTLTDALTGAFNRRHLDQTLAMAVERGRRHKPGDAMLMIDIDHFKRVNDDHGHDGGDEVLRQLVRVLQARLRRTDMVFRMGGEEFVALLRDTDGESAARVAESLRGLVEQSTWLPGLAVTISIGVCAQQAGQSADQWLKAADQALYGAKNGGRNRVQMAAAEGKQ